MARVTVTSFDVIVRCLLLIGPTTSFFIRPCGLECDYVPSQLRFSCTGISLTCIPKPCCIDRTRTLDLSINNITTVGPLAFQSFPNLNTLDLKLNSIQVLSPWAFQGLRYLQTLDLRGNRLEILRAGVFEGLLNLRSLILSRNRINDIQPGTFRLLPNLKILKLHHNAIQVVYPDAFAHVTSLVTLDLDSNKIHTVYYGSFTTLVSLQTLSLAYNKIASLPEFLGTLTDLEDLSLRGNPLYCDCSLEFLRQWYRAAQGDDDSYRKSGECSQPLRMTGRLLGSIRKQLRCDGFDSNSYESVSSDIEVTTATANIQQITAHDAIMSSPGIMTSASTSMSDPRTSIAIPLSSRTEIWSQYAATSGTVDISVAREGTTRIEKENAVASTATIIPKSNAKQAKPTVTDDNVTTDLSYTNKPNEEGQQVTSSTLTETASKADSDTMNKNLQSQTVPDEVVRDRSDVTLSNVVRPLNDSSMPNTIQTVTKFPNNDRRILEDHPVITERHGEYEVTLPSNQQTWPLSTQPEEPSIPITPSYESRESNVMTSNQNDVDSQVETSSIHVASDAKPMRAPLRGGLLGKYPTPILDDMSTADPERVYAETTVTNFQEPDGDDLHLFNDSTQPDEVRIVMVGELVQLECPVSILAPLRNYLSDYETKWLSPSGQWVEVSSMNRFTKSKNGTLSIARVEASDQGTYHCVQAQYMEDPSVTSVDLRVSCPCHQIPEMNFVTTSGDMLTSDEASSPMKTTSSPFDKTDIEGYEASETVTCTRVPVAVAVLITFQVTVALCTIAFCAFLSWRSTRRPAQGNRRESFLERPRTVSEVNYYDSGEVPNRVSEVPTIVYESTGDDDIVEESTEITSESDSALSSSGSHRNSAVDSEYVNARPVRRDTETYADLDPQSRARHDTYSSLHLPDPTDYE